MAMVRARHSIALATYDKRPELAPDDQVLVPALESEGFDVHRVVWSDADVRWESFDAVVIRSCWDYHLRIIEFNAWLDRLDLGGVRVFNSSSLIRWNSNKRYLVELAGHGTRTVPTRIVPAGHALCAAEILRDEGWPRAVIKPVISASGYETYAISVPLDDNGRATVERVTRAGDALLQPFADEVARVGEFSFVFIDGVHSHATIKRAGRGEFRVQTEHGGSVDPVHAPPPLVSQAAAILALLPETPLYARVDGIERDGAFVLMELELIEPNLFFEHGTGSAARFAAAMRQRLNA
jgi:glutathione synthase/RimK-type ligase-like ATP-grasp enzyme